MSKLYKPDLKRMVPMFFTRLKVPDDFTKGEVSEEERQMFFGTFRTYGGTEINVSGVYDVIDTATIVTWYNPDITRDSVIYLEDGRQYDVINEPENLDMAYQLMKFKVKRRNLKVHKLDLDRFDKQITFIKYEEVETSLHQTKYENRDYITVFANVEHLSGTEYRDVKIRQESDYTFTVRYHEGKVDKSKITPQMKIRYDNRYFDISDVEDVEEVHEYIKIRARESSSTKEDDLYVG